MDIAAILSSQGPALLEKLESVGFSAEQAQQFLPEAGQQLTAALGSGGGLGDLLGGDAVTALVEKIDIAGIASSLGIDAELVSRGVQALVPQIVDGLKGDAGGLLGGLGSKLLG